MLIAGERLNASRKGMAPAIKEKDADIIRGGNCTEAGADYIDVNAAPFREYVLPLVKMLPPPSNYIRVKQ